MHGVPGGSLLLVFVLVQSATFSYSGMQSILMESETPMPFFYGLTRVLWIVFLFISSPSAGNPHLHALLVLLGNAQQAFLVCSGTVWRLSVF